MASVRQFISDIQSDGKFETLDSYISPRWIHSKTKKILSNFVAKDNNSNKLLGKNVEVWTEISIPMEEVEIQEFSDLNINNCQKLMRSKYKLPSIYSSKFGAIIKTISSLDIGRTYDILMSMRIWKDAQAQEFKSKKYAVFISGFLYIPIPKGDQASPKQIRMEAFFQDLFEVQKYNELIGQAQKSCASAVDYELPIPYYIQDDVSKEIIRQLAVVYLKIPKDEFPNLSEIDKSNQREKTRQ